MGKWDLLWKTLIYIQLFWNTSITSIIYAYFSHWSLAENSYLLLWAHYSAIYLTTKGALDFFSVADRHLGAHSIYSSPGNNIWRCSFRKYLFPTLSLHGLSGANFPPSLPSCVNSHPSLVGEDTSLHPIPAIVTGSGMGNKIQSWSSHWNYWKR